LESGNLPALLDEEALATRLRVERSDCHVACQSVLQLLRGSGLVGIDVSVTRVIEALHLGDRPYPRRLQGPRVLLFPEFLETVLLCAARWVRKARLVNLVGEAR
jgi:hypothetical protein